MAIKLDLSTVPVFQFVSADARGKLGRIAKALEKDRGDALLVHGEAVLGIYIVAEGLVGVYPPGSQRALVRLGPSSSFGEMSFLEQTTASATIRAEQDATRVVLIFQADLAELIASDAPLGQALFRGMALTLSQRLRSTTERIAQELVAGRRLLADLSRDEVELSLANLPSEVIQQNKKNIVALDACRERLDQHLATLSDRPPPLVELGRAMAEIRSSCEAFQPRLERQLQAITGLIRSMEEFIEQVTCG